jgi:hypothetical protein
MVKKEWKGVGGQLRWMSMLGRCGQWTKNVKERIWVYQKKKCRQAPTKREVRVRDIADVVIGATLGWKRTLLWDNGITRIHGGRYEQASYQH